MRYVFIILIVINSSESLRANTCIFKTTTSITVQDLYRCRVGCTKWNGSEVSFAELNFYFDYKINLQKKVNKTFKNHDSLTSLLDFCLNLNKSHISTNLTKVIKIKEACKLILAYEVNRKFIFQYKFFSPSSINLSFEEIHRKNYENVTVTLWNDILTKR